MTQAERPPADSTVSSPPVDTSSFLIVVVLVVAGAAIGLAIAYVVAGGTPVAALVGFMAVPLAVGFPGVISPGRGSSPTRRPAPAG